MVEMIDRDLTLMMVKKQKMKCINPDYNRGYNEGLDTALRVIRNIPGTTAIRKIDILADEKMLGMKLCDVPNMKISEIEASLNLLVYILNSMNEKQKVDIFDNFVKWSKVCDG